MGILTFIAAKKQPQTLNGNWERSPDLHSTVCLRTLSDGGVYSHRFKDSSKKFA
jgi:hypothetical protein